MLGLDEKKDICFSCSKENRDKNVLKCTGCKNILHVKCAGKTGISNKSLEDITKQPEKFTCNPCMSGFTQSVEYEDPHNYSAEVENLARKSIEFKKVEEPLAKESTSEPITIDDEIETQSASNDCSNIADNKCTECDELKHEIVQLRNHLKLAQEELNNKQKDATPCDQCDNLRNSNKKVKEQLELSQVAYNETKVNLEKTEGLLEEKKNENVQLVSEVQDLKAKIDALTSDANDESNPVNARLKDFCVQLQKDKLKMIVAHTKEKKEIEKAKIDAEDGLKAAILENKDLKVRDDTLMGIYSCLQNVLNKKTDEVSSDPPTTAAQNVDLDDKNASGNDTNNKGKSATIIVCDQCEFQSRSEPVMNEHVEMDHQQKKQKVVYVCDECEGNFDSQMEFRKHARVHKKDNFPCDHCGMKLNSLEGLDNHISMFHKQQNIPCDFCRYKAYNEEALVMHLEEKHKIFKHRANNGDNSKGHPASSSNFHSTEERKRNGFCSFWNNGFCKYEEKCRFAHEEIPFCHFQERCNRKETCKFFHKQPQRHRSIQQRSHQQYQSQGQKYQNQQYQSQGQKYQNEQYQSQGQQNQNQQYQSQGQQNQNQQYQNQQYQGQGQNFGPRK